ncbi:MAG: class I SAM-dependent methyltransferase [Gammaproteobacteria bacterium]|nr:MAG: class I SAM-dependent methyltransferase [Gammaproteobacteria bacterium]
MKISTDHYERTCPESEIYNSLLSLDDKNILELGCGRGELTRAIAEAGHGRQVVALEVDEVQHMKNLEVTDLPNVSFKLAGMQGLPEAGESFDVVFMFKSLHHVPATLMQKGFEEVHRVLKPGGYAYISEPIFAGNFNEILRLFHDEERVRQAAFQAEQAAVNAGLFKLVSQTFFKSPMAFECFSEFEEKVIGVTHTDHQLSPELHEQVRTRFMQFSNEAGARFEMPIRVDLLQKPLDH